MENEALREPRKLPTFLSYNSGTAGPILDSKVALEMQFGAWQVDMKVA